MASLLKTQAKERKKPASETKRTKPNRYRHFIEGERIYLRDVELKDVTVNYCGWLNDREVNQFLETRFSSQTKASIEEYVRRMRQDSSSVFLAVILKDNHRHIGNIKMGPINWIHRFADISLLLGDKANWGKGYGTEAIRLTIQYAFEKLNLHRLQATIYETNQGSIKAFKKAGFSEEGTARQKRFLDGHYMDEKIFGILNE